MGGRFDCVGSDVLSKSGTVSIRTVADRANVSTATVSNVLSGKTTVTPMLAERVRAVVEELGYVANGSASRLRSGKQALAGVVVPDLGNPFFGGFVSTLEREARQDGFDLLVVSSHNDPAQEAERLHSIRSWRTAGLIVMPCDGGLSARLPRAGRPPIVCVDRIPDDGGFDLIAVDNAAAAGRVAAHCADQGFGSCLVVGSSIAISNIRERWSGIVDAAGPMKVDLFECGLDPAAVEDMLRERLSAKPRPELLFSLDQGTSLVAYQCLGDLGLGGPGGIAFASFDETEWMRLVTPGVTAVRQPVAAMAGAAWQRLKQRIGGDSSPPATLRLACSVQIRSSTLRPHGPSRQTAA